MSTTLTVDRSRVCAFLSVGGRGCTMPLSASHPFLCTYHARKEAQARAAQIAGRDIAHSLAARYISHNDLSAALAQTISAVAQHHISSRTASAIANLSRTLLQSVAGAQNEYIASFGDDAWTEKVAINLSSLRPAKPGELLRDDLQDAFGDNHPQEAAQSLASQESSYPGSEYDDDRA
jgi:soluble lytic murein transglycosylase-like protein